MPNPPGLPRSDVALPLAGLHIGLDARRRPAVGGTGVDTYREVLRATLERLGAHTHRLSDVEGKGVRNARVRRWLRAVSRTDRAASSAPRIETSWVREDVFREAQAHFSLYGRLLPVRVPDPPDLMHWAYPLPLRLVGARNVYTVHDVIPWRSPQLTGISRRRFVRLLTCVAAAADYIVTVSEHSRTELLEMLDYPAERVVNTYQAMAPVEAPDALPEGLAAGRYLLFCGSVEPRKNVAGLIAAHRRSRVELPLVIVGPDGWRAREELAGADGGVIRLPWLPRPALMALIGSARALLFPSRAEGFGLPVLEAMTLGAPVVACDHGAVREVAGRGALLVNPDDLSAWSHAIRQVSYDDGICDALRHAGRDRALCFSDRLYAERLAHAYHAALATPRRNAGLA